MDSLASFRASSRSVLRFTRCHLQASALALATWTSIDIERARSQTHPAIEQASITRRCG